MLNPSLIDLRQSMEKKVRVDVEKHLWFARGSGGRRWFLLFYLVNIVWD